MTRLLGVIGDPISHSLSPVIHNNWLRAAGINATYEAMQVADGDLPHALKILSERQPVGVNITLPHKQAALAYSSEASEAAQAVGAANTLTYIKNSIWKADNTDVPGFLRALEAAGLPDISGKTALLVGAGGSARALAYAMGKAGARLIILNRTVSKAQTLIETFGNDADLSGSLEQLSEYSPEADFVVNTSSRGHSGDYIALPPGKNRLFLDISYGSAAVGQLSEAAKSGWKTEDGLMMLVSQAAESFKIWFDEYPDTDGALARCRKLVEATS